MSKFDIEDGCVTFPILFIVLIIKCALVLVAYGFAIMMCCTFVLCLPLVIIGAIIENNSEMILRALFGWFDLAQEFSNRLFK